MRRDRSGQNSRPYADSFNWGTIAVFPAVPCSLFGKPGILAERVQGYFEVSWFNSTRFLASLQT